MSTDQANEAYCDDLLDEIEVAETELATAQNTYDKEQGKLVEKLKQDMYDKTGVSYDEYTASLDAEYEAQEAFNDESSTLKELMDGESPDQYATEIEGYIAVEDAIDDFESTIADLEGEISDIYQEGIDEEGNYTQDGLNSIASRMRAKQQELDGVQEQVDALYDQLGDQGDKIPGDNDAEVADKYDDYNDAWDDYNTAKDSQKDLRSKAGDEYSDVLNAENGSHPELQDEAGEVSDAEEYLDELLAEYEAKCNQDEESEESGDTGDTGDVS